MGALSAGEPRALALAWRPCARGPAIRRAGTATRELRGLMGLRLVRFGKDGVARGTNDLAGMSRAERRAGASGRE